jgi:hypothetical protein
MRHSILFFLSFFAACAQGDPARGVMLFYQQSYQAIPRQDAVPYCYGYGCRIREKYALTEDEWARVATPFQETAMSAAQEREKIHAATAIYEAVTGERFQTHMDRGGTFPGVGEKGQLDCTDEAFNTTTLLYLLQEANFLQFHTLRGPASRLSLWPHTTAVIIEHDSGQSFAVDSWFGASGAGAHIVPLSQWKKGWHPDEE